MSKYIHCNIKYIVASIVFATIEVICVSYYPLALSNIIDNFGEMALEDIVKMSAALIMSIVMILLSSYCNKMVKAKYEQKVCFDIRKDVFNQIISWNYQRFHEEKYDKYTSFLVNDVDQLYKLYFENLIYFINRIVMLVTYTIILFYVSWQMCIVIMLSYLIIIFVPTFVGQRYNTLNKKYSESRSEFLASSEELLTAHDVAFGNRQGDISRHFEASIDGLQKHCFNLKKYMAFIQTISGGTLYFQLIFCFVFGIFFTYKEIISVGIFTSSLLYIEYISQYTCNIINEYLEIKSADTYLAHYKEIMKDGIAIKKVNNEKFSSIQLENVGYNYKQKILYNNINMEIEHGKKYLIIGDNGTGKTTLLKIISGIISPTTGNIYYNHKDEINYNEISYIPQERYVFEGTIIDNILLFREKYTLKEREEIISLCKKINLLLPVDYFVSRDGQNISGGEKAKICLVRDLLSEKNLIFIDEPFNDIDEKSQKDIMKFLKNLSATVVMVSHNIQDKSAFDEVYSINDKKLYKKIQIDSD